MDLAGCFHRQFGSCLSTTANIPEPPSPPAQSESQAPWSLDGTAAGCLWTGPASCWASPHLDKRAYLTLFPPLPSGRRQRLTGGSSLGAGEQGGLIPCSPKQDILPAHGARCLTAVEKGSGPQAGNEATPLRRLLPAALAQRVTQPSCTGFPTR